MIYVIGSRAISQYFSDFREPLDYDIVGPYDECITFIKSLGDLVKCEYPAPNKMVAVVWEKNPHPTNRLIIEAEIDWGNPKYTTSELVSLCDDSLWVRNKDSALDIRYVGPSVVYMLKMSHRYLKNSPSFLKTMRDIQYLRSKGVTIPPYMGDFYQKRMKETYSYQHPNLNRSKDSFFSDDSVPYLYDHDDVHKAVAHLDKPAYEYYKVPGADVLCSKELFFQQPMLTRLYGVIEETYVLALERSQIPSNFTEDPKVSFDIALMKVCTSITSGWFREFAWEHYDEVQQMYNPNYVTKCIEAIPTMRKYQSV